VTLLIFKMALGATFIMKAIVLIVMSPFDAADIALSLRKEYGDRVAKGTKDEHTGATN
jgi:hypothetical protein